MALKLIPKRIRRRRASNSPLSPSHRSIPLGQFFNVDGLRTHVVVRGEGSPVILVHGLASYVYSWRHNLNELAKSHRVYALDLPGFGFSDKPSNHDYSLGAQAEFIKSFMDLMKIPQASFAGNSMGGGVVLEMAMRHPERVKGIIIIGSVGVRKEQFAPWMRKMTSTIMRSGFAGLIVPGPRRMRWLMGQLYHDRSKILPQDVEAYLLPLQTPEFKRALSSMLATLHLKLSNTERLTQIDHPTLILWGEEDRVMSKDIAFHFKNSLRQAQLVIVPNAGHSLIQERPEVANQHMLSFLEQLDAQS